MRHIETTVITFVNPRQKKRVLLDTEWIDTTNPTCVIVILIENCTGKILSREVYPWTAIKKIETIRGLA
jgi:hypothetical protein